MPRFVAASGPSLYDAAFLGVARDGSHWVGVVRRAPPQSKMPLDIGFRLGTLVLIGKELYRGAAAGELWAVARLIAKGLMARGTPGGVTP